MGNMKAIPKYSVWIVARHWLELYIRSCQRLTTNIQTDVMNASSVREYETFFSV